MRRNKNKFPFFHKNKSPEKIEKSWDFTMKASSDDTDDYYFEGIASTYGNPDCYKDIFANGSLDDNIGKTVAIMPNHSWDILKAIGSGKLEKDGKKILIKGNFIKDDELSEKIVKLKKSGVPIKLSIGGRILESKIIRQNGETYRSITKAEIMEVSVVFQGANPKAGITKGINENQGGDMELKEILKQLGITEEQYEGMKKNAEIFSGVLETIKKMEGSVNVNTEKGNEEIKKEMEGKIEEIKKEYANKIEKMNQTLLDLQKSYTGSKENEKVEMEKAFNSLNSFIKTGVKDENFAKALNTDPSSGGVLLPNNKEKEIIKEVIEMSTAMKEAKVYTISKGNQLTIRVKVKGTNNAHAQAEGADAGTKSGSTYTNLELKVGKITDTQSITQEMIDDPEFNALREVIEDSTENTADYISDKFWNGTVAGDQQVEGIYTNTTVTTAALESANAGTFDWEDLKNLIYSLKQSIRARSKFFVSTAALSKMRGFKDTTGQPLYVDPLTAGEPGMFMGYKVIEEPRMNDVTANKYPVFFGDMSKFYAFLNRKGITIERDRQAGNDTWDIYTRTRLGGRVRQASQGKLLKIKSA